MSEFLDTALPPQRRISGISARFSVWRFVCKAMNVVTAAGPVGAPELQAPVEGLPLEVEGSAFEQVFLEMIADLPGWKPDVPAEESASSGDDAPEDVEPTLQEARLESIPPVTLLGITVTVLPDNRLQEFVPIRLGEAVAPEVEEIGDSARVSVPMEIRPLSGTSEMQEVVPISEELNTSPPPEPLDTKAIEPLTKDTSPAEVRLLGHVPVRPAPDAPMPVPPSVEDAPAPEIDQKTSASTGKPSEPEPSAPIAFAARVAPAPDTTPPSGQHSEQKIQTSAPVSREVLRDHQGSQDGRGFSTPEQTEQETETAADAAPGIEHHTGMIAASIARAVETAEVASTPAAERTTGAKQASEPMRDIAVQLGDGEENVHVRFVERGGELRVVVRTAAPELAGALREEMPILLQGLERSGMRAETWSPSDAPARTEPLHQTSGPTEVSNLETGDHLPGDEQQRRRQPQPEWLEELLRRRKLLTEEEEW